MAKRQSPVFLPDDPTKSASRTSLMPYAQPIVYVHAWHLYYAGTGIPEHPPCPVHGWQAAKYGKVDLRSVSPTVVCIICLVPFCFSLCRVMVVLSVSALFGMVTRESGMHRR